MEKSSKENLANDIENRLDNLFDSDDESDAPGTQGNDVPLEKLKSVVLSIDWEITETCLNELIDETDLLLPKHENDRFSHALLRMLKAVGLYIRKRKAQAHPDAINRVMSVFSSIEKLLENTELDENARTQIVGGEINAFKSLKEKIESKRSVAHKKTETAAASDQEYIGCEQFKNEISAIEERFNEQVKSLKAQVESIQKEIDRLQHT